MELFKKIFRALLVLLWVQEEHKLVDFEWLGTGFSVIIYLVFMVCCDEVVHVLLVIFVDLIQHLREVRWLMG